MPQVPGRYTEVYINKGQLCLSKDNMERPVKALDKAGSRSAMPMGDFQSVVGLLQYACKVVTLGRAFTRRLHTFFSIEVQLIRLIQEAREDLTWWHTFVCRWSGVSLM